MNQQKTFDTGGSAVGGFGPDAQPQPDAKEGPSRFSVKHLVPPALPVSPSPRSADASKETQDAEILAQQLDTALECMSDAYFLVDREWRLQRVNREFERLLQCTREQVIGKGLWDQFTDVSVNAFAAEYERAVRDNINVMFEAYYPPASLWFQVRAFPCARGLSVYFRDVTAKHSRNAALESQLQLGRHMEALGSLSGGIAHDFNNTLAVILGNLAMARADIDPQHPAQATLQHVETAALSGRELVRRILAFSRQEPERLSPQALQPVVERALGLLRAALPANVALQKQFVGEMLLVNLNAALVEQVVMNVCINAWHALPDRSGHITVGLEAIDLDVAAASQLAPLDPGRVAHLWVRDDGCGMSEETMSRMFEPYFTTKAAGVGTGLGMALVQSAIASLGATLRVESALGLGTTVHVYFSVQHAEAVEPLRTASERPRAQTVPHIGGAPRILVVDDDEALRLMFERLLVRADYQVTTCAGAAEALVLMQANPCAYSLLVTDQNMLGQSGLQLAESFKQINDAVPIIITSGHLTEELSEKAMRLGVHALLPKEDAFEQLVGAVAMALHEASAESTSSEPRHRAAYAP